MKLENNQGCRCGAPVRIIDVYGRSATVFCDKCERYSLGIECVEGRHLIFLADFHLKRGDGPDQRPLFDLKMATKLYQCLIDDIWPSPATVTDYGIESARHLGALQHAVLCGCTAYELDRVMGDGRAITELVHGAPGQPYGPVEFRTPYDELASHLCETK